VRQCAKVPRGVDVLFPHALAHSVWGRRLRRRTRSGVVSVSRTTFHDLHPHIREQSETASRKDRPSLELLVYEILSY
jgi:hypothetical protein